MVKLITIMLTLMLTFDAEAGRYHGRKRVKRFFSQTATVGPNTEYLVVSKSCGPCIKAIEIITKLQDEGYDVVIIDKKQSKFRVRVTPTLIVRERGKTKKVVGLKTEEKYKELISQ